MLFASLLCFLAIFKSIKLSTQIEYIDLYDNVTISIQQRGGTTYYFQLNTDILADYYQININFTIPWIDQNFSPVSAENDIAYLTWSGYNFDESLSVFYHQNNSIKLKRDIRYANQILSSFSIKTYPWEDGLYISLYLDDEKRIDFSYELNVQGDSQQLCPFNCFGNGRCSRKGKCKCDIPYLFYDCSIFGKYINQDEQLQLTIQDEPYFLIFQPEDSKPYTINVEVLEEKNHIQMYVFNQNNWYSENLFSSNFPILCSYEHFDVQNSPCQFTGQSFQFGIYQIIVAIGIKVEIKPSQSTVMNIKITSDYESQENGVEQKPIQNNEKNQKKNNESKYQQQYFQNTQSNSQSNSEQTSANNLLIICITIPLGIILLVFQFYCFRRCYKKYIEAKKKNSDVQNAQAQQNAPQITKTWSITEQDLHTIQKKIDPAQCSVCLQVISRFSKQRSIAPCKHVFHENCIQMWLSRQKRQTGQNTCPNCRAQII